MVGFDREHIVAFTLYDGMGESSLCQILRVSSNASTFNFFNRLWIVETQGVIFFVKPRAFASAGCERAQVAIDVHPYVRTSIR